MTEAVPQTSPSELPPQLVRLVTEHLEVNVDPAELSAQTTLESLGVDSLGMMELVVAAEAEFGIVVPDEALDLSLTTSLGDVARVIARAA
ncbi:acyl carrier protein [Streptomyces sp. UNOB3_S3]|uniref:acyl carrier protein n=1 Tax=Streptomyces sp. UNOB3_S3 TaxID=2871682 RepID=UPI001E419F86|nr:phosphopantetheine-binding protein [Streptomyces sp. UNOB3_S3]MCC3776101.1 acyl carrier protein [Streptomyces sp. UNOB3_S3]